MAFIDLPLDALRASRPERDESADFDAFWAETPTETRRLPVAPIFTPVAAGLRLVETFDVSFTGWGGHRINAWLLLPRDRPGPLPTVVEFVGYGGGRGNPTDWLLWSAVGYAHLVMDTRGKGGAWLHGDTPDPAPGGDPASPGFLTRGVLDPKTCYYRRVSAAVRAVETARAHPAVDAARVAVAGGSQGGGIALAGAGLLPDLAAVVASVPFLCRIRRATEITDAHPYAEVAGYCRTHRDRVERVFATLAYVDAVHFAARAAAPALVSVGLLDEVCPPSTVFAAHNHDAGPKELPVWPYLGHEGGGSHQAVESVRFLGPHLAE